MAINPETQYPGKIDPSSTEYPYGKARNITTPGDGTGTPWEAALVNDLFGSQQALLRSAGIVPSGSADQVGASQYLQAVVELASGRASIYDGGGVADAYTATPRTNQEAPAAYFDGMVVYAAPNANNTGAATLNVDGLGVTNIKLRGGSADPEADDLVNGRLERFVYRTAPSAHFEMSRAGQVRVTVISATDAAWAPRADTGSMRITAIGAGGGGGGADGQGAASWANGTCGASGSLCIKYLTVIDPTYNITIGAGGTGGAAGNNNGTAGGDTTVEGSVGPGTNCDMVSPGGLAGIGRIGTTGNTRSQGSLGGGVATGGDLNMDGQESGPSIGVGGEPGMISSSGASIFGGGRYSSVGSAAGIAATTPGNGGTGGTSLNEGTNFAGGDGADGLVVIEEFLT